VVLRSETYRQESVTYRQESLRPQGTTDATEFFPLSLVGSNRSTSKIGSVTPLSDHNFMEYLHGSAENVAYLGISLKMMNLDSQIFDPNATGGAHCTTGTCSS
jgi:hypothetical protein